MRIPPIKTLPIKTSFVQKLLYPGIIRIAKQHTHTHTKKNMVDR